MNIKLENIGIVSNSEIEIEGLTVITGHNNSGKTTVGKVVYSLIDAVSNIEVKALIDRYHYAIKQLKDANKEFSYRGSLKRGADQIENECIRIFFSEKYEQYISLNNVEEFLNNLLNELESFSIIEKPYKEIIKNDFQWIFSAGKVDEEEFLNEKENARLIISKALYEITRDTELINYAKQSVNETLSLEFSGQIQPVARKGVTSSIEMMEGKKTCFSFEIQDDEIVKTDKPVYMWMPYKNTYFIDNPYIVGEPISRKTTSYTTQKISYVDEAHILSHENKLKHIINSPIEKTIFEAGIIDERYKEISAKIEEVLPGEFEYTPEGQYYVHNGVNLKASNLATGSKMFSIIKLLLSKGEITEKTLLVLDEPEAHLHPKWQNSFAEIMILLVKELGCHILLTTHSPNFMLALEANMRKYKAVDVCNFYQTENIEDSPFVNYRCVNDSLEDIYEDFVIYLSEMKNIRNAYLE